MASFENLDIRMLIVKNGLKNKDVADKMNISREWFSRLLRTELSNSNKARIIEAIRDLSVYS